MLTKHEEALLMMTTPLSHLMTPGASERRAFGIHWCMAPDLPAHGEEVLCARYEATSEEGRTALVYRTAYPAVFYRIQAGDLSLSTGSGLYQLAADLAAALANGTLGISQRIPHPR